MSFSARLPVLEFLDLLVKNFPRDKFMHLKGFKIGFTHFFTLFDPPDGRTLLDMFNRHAAGTLRPCSEGGDLVIPIMWKKIWEDEEEDDAMMTGIGEREATEKL